MDLNINITKIKTGYLVAVSEDIDDEYMLEKWAFKDIEDTTRFVAYVLHNGSDVFTDG